MKCRVCVNFFYVKQGSGNHDNWINTINPPGDFAWGICLQGDGPKAHTARGRDGRQEGRERGYYNLHRNLNHSFLHGSPPLVPELVEGLITVAAASRCQLWGLQLRNCRFRNCMKMQKVINTHNLVLIQKVKDVRARYWYMVQCIKSNWKVDYLKEVIARNDYGKHGALANNFADNTP